MPVVIVLESRVAGHWRRGPGRRWLSIATGERVATVLSRARYGRIRLAPEAGRDSGGR